MSIRLITTRFAMLVLAGGLWTVGCGGGESPTRPAPTPPSPPPTPPPAPTVSVVEVSPSTATLQAGGTQRFVATAKASDGTVISGVSFTWSSSNTAVATINNGVVTAVAAGTATIRATGNGVSSAAVTITVTVAAVANVTVSPSSTQELMVGEMVTFTATARTAGGAIRSDVSIIWASSDTSVVTITSAGVATAVDAGSAMVRATADGISSSPVTINVAEPPPPEPVVATVTVRPASMMIMVGGMFQFTAVAMTADGMVVDDVEFTWMSDDPEVATVDGSGMVTAVAAGTAMITATGNDVTSMPATVTVAESAPMVDSVEIVDAMPAMLEIGGTLQLMAVARTADGTMIGGATISWSSDDIGVATVDTTGLVTAVGAGMADITAMTEETTSDPVTVTVAEPPEVVRVAVEPMTATIEEGEMQQFTATAFDADDMEITGKTFTWSSSNTTVATINSSSGLASAMEAGSTTITAMVDGKSGTAMLTVTEPPPPPPPVVDRVTVSPSSPSIEEGETQQFSAMAFESDSTVISGKTFTWTSSDTSKATISSSGLATGKSAGSTTIRASVDGKSGMATLTVTAPTPPPPPPPMLRSRTATISGSYSAAGSVTLSEGAGGQLKLTITGFRSTAPDTWLALSEKASIDWAVGETLPSTARSFGEVTGMTSFTSTFTPPSGKDIDSYDYIILYCRQFDLRISSNAFSN